MTSKKLGRNTLKAEVSHVSSQGLWVLVGDKEYFLGYAEYPWFSEAKVSEVMQVELLHRRHLRWPLLDVDLELESLDYPDKFPLIYGRKGKLAAPGRAAR